MTVEEMVGWHDLLNEHGFGWTPRVSDGHEFGQTPGAGDGLGGLECCNSWGCKELDMTEQLN